jgi:hypothetical protein
MPANVKQRMLRDRRKLITMYHRERMSLSDIGRKYGCSRQYVQTVFMALGIERRERLKALSISGKRRKSKYDFGPGHDRFIRDNYRNMTDEQIARNLRKPASAVTYRRLIVLGKKKNERRDFTRNENRFILKNYRRLTDHEMARTLKRSLISITHHRSRVLNRAKRRIRSYSTEEDLFIRETYLSLDDTQLARILNRSRSSVAVHRGEVLGLKRPDDRRRGQE